MFSIVGIQIEINVTFEMFYKIGHLLSRRLFISTDNNSYVYGMCNIRYKLRGVENAKKKSMLLHGRMTNGRPTKMDVCKSIVVARARRNSVVLAVTIFL